LKFKLFTICFLFAVFATAQNLNVTFRSQLNYGSGISCSNICGYVDTTGREYALVGTSQGMSVVDISDPDKPVEVKQITGPGSRWREIKVKGNYAYVTTEGGGGLQIVNLGSLPTATGITSKFWKDIFTGSLSSIHALHIDGNYAYLYGSNLYQGPLLQ
jgi:hypothetical protein